MDTATGKNKVINIQGQERKVIASWRLTSLGEVTAAQQRAAGGKSPRGSGSALN
jgi:hypothetical protein